MVNLWKEYRKKEFTQAIRNMLIALLTGIVVVAVLGQKIPSISANIFLIIIVSAIMIIVFDFSLYCVNNKQEEIRKLKRSIFNFEVINMWSFESYFNNSEKAWEKHRKKIKREVSQQYRDRFYQSYINYSLIRATWILAIATIILSILTLIFR